jgi:hypothetical protein
VRMNQSLRFPIRQSFSKNVTPQDSYLKTTAVYNTIMTSPKRLDEILNLLSYEVFPPLPNKTSIKSLLTSRRPTPQSPSPATTPTSPTAPSASGLSSAKPSLLNLDPVSSASSPHPKDTLSVKHSLYEQKREGWS